MKRQRMTDWMRWGLAHTVTSRRWLHDVTRWRDPRVLHCWRYARRYDDVSEREHPCNLGYTNFGQLKKWFRTDGLEPTFAYIIRESWIYIQVKIIQFRQLVLELFMRGTRHSIRKSWPFIFARFPMSPIFKHFKTLFPKRIFKRNLASRR